MTHVLAGKREPQSAIFALDFRQPRINDAVDVSRCTRRDGTSKPEYAASFGTAAETGSF
jgi:hypothetical protein